MSGAFQFLIPTEDAPEDAVPAWLVRDGWRSAGPATWEAPGGTAAVRLVEDAASGVRLIEVSGPEADDVARRIAAAVPTWTLDALEARTRHGQEPEVSLHAIRRLGLLPHPPPCDDGAQRYVRVWSRMLHHPDRHVRLETLRAMRYRSPALLGPLLADAELEEPDSEVRAEIRRTFDTIPPLVPPPGGGVAAPDDDLPF